MDSGHASNADFKVYEVPKKGRAYYMVRYKQDGGMWCSKFAPAKLKTLDEVRAWFPAWLAGERAGTSGVVRRIKERYPTLQNVRIEGSQIKAEVPDGFVIDPTIAMLARWWLAYRANDPNLRDFRGHLNNWILGKGTKPRAKIADRVIQQLQPAECREWIRSIHLAPPTCATWWPRCGP
jgi:hypothetical protein